TINDVCSILKRLKAMSAPLLISESPEINIALEIQISHRYELSIKTTTKIVIKNEIKVEK
ncbi:hypothetical protein CGH44_24830, partial [Vibrio parahaemolyticus]|uniref:hypothetical protein n=1 Tax=Vibrio parahaemolyticus TaxID=670 RepID=UPI00116CE4F3